MIALNSNLSRVLFSTVRIITTKSNGTIASGTAFFFEFPIKGQVSFPVLITNKHVVKDAVEGTFFVHEALENEDAPKSTSFSITIQNFEQSWINHPGDVDLCALPIGNLKRILLANGKKFYHSHFDESLFPTEEILQNLTPMEDVVMVGYPIGLWDNVNNLPILRRGVTASHPATDFQGISVGVVDIAAFPGSSGSPILILNEGGFVTPTGLHLGNRTIFLGVLYGGPQYAADGSIEIVNVPTVQTSIVNTMIPTHLGFYIKAKEINELKNHAFELNNISDMSEEDLGKIVQEASQESIKVEEVKNISELNSSTT